MITHNSSPSARLSCDAGGRLPLRRIDAIQLDLRGLAIPQHRERITVGDSPAGVAVAPDGGHVYVANTDSNTVSVIDV